MRSLWLRCSWCLRPSRKCSRGSRWGCRLSMSGSIIWISRRCRRLEWLWGSLRWPRGRMRESCLRSIGFIGSGKILRLNTDMLRRSWIAMKRNNWLETKKGLGYWLLTTLWLEILKKTSRIFWMRVRESKSELMKQWVRDKRNWPKKTSQRFWELRRHKAQLLRVTWVSHQVSNRQKTFLKTILLVLLKLESKAIDRTMQLWLQAKCLLRKKYSNSKSDVLKEFKSLEKIKPFTNVKQF